MGNMLMAVQEFAQSLKRQASVRSQRSEPGVVQEDLLLSKLMELQKVELWRVHWCLNQELLQDFPPIPRHWLQSADANSTAKTMRRCYCEGGALSMLDAALTMLGRNDWASHLYHTVDRPRPRLAPEPDPDLLRTQRRKLISRMQRLDSVLDSLQHHGILNTTNREAINIYAVHKEKNRALVDLVLRKGDKAQEVFYNALSQSEPFLLQELEDGPFIDQNQSEASVLTEMLEFLVSDELRSFQWLVSDHMTGEGCPPVGGEQLQDADGPMTRRLLEKHFGPKQAEDVAMNILLKMVPTLSVCLQGEAVTSQRLSDIKVKTSMNTTVVDITPEVSEDCTMFRLRCQQPGVFHCTMTGLMLEGVGDVLYQVVPWDLDFLSSKGLRPAGPLFRFTLLNGNFHRLHLPHCQLLPDGSQHLSVAHVTGDSVDFITPGQVTKSHVIVDVSSFSCFGLVMWETSTCAIKGLVLLFSHLSDRSLFVLLLPRNVCLNQVRKEWKQRARADYVETVPDCELIPNHTYELHGQPVSFIQPESSKFVNFSDYNNFLPSFHVQLEVDRGRVELQLSSHVTAPRMIGWLFGSTEPVVWRQVIQLRAAASTVCTEESVDVTLLLLNVLNSLGSDDLKTFKHFLSLWPDSIPYSRLEAADRARTVDLMVQQYHTEGAKQVTEEILRKMNYNHRAEQLHFT